MLRTVIVFLSLLAFCFQVEIGQGKGPTPEKTITREKSETSAEPNQNEFQPSGDAVRDMQSLAMIEQKAAWGHWGNQPDKYSTWINHSNRLIPVYTFGITLDALRDEGSVYTDPERLKKLYGRVPAGTVNPTAMYYDQTDIYRLQMAAVEAGYSNIILMIFDGMDWQTTRAAALYKQHQSGRTRGPSYTSGRGTGLSFQDDRRIKTDFGLLCTSARLSGAKVDATAQTVVNGDADPTGGYDPIRGGEAPWHEQSAREYLLGTDREQPHTVTDSASAATSMTAGIKTYNSAVNVAVDGTHVIPIARTLQAEQDFKVGLVTNVPVTHATPAAAYANNVTRQDYQDIGRDLLGLPSSSHRDNPVPGVDVLIGGGWGEGSKAGALQGDNFMPGNPYLHQEDIKRADIKNGGKYIVAQRTPGKSGRKRLMAAARRAADDDSRLLGFFGTKRGHLPFQTADGKFNPTFDVKGTEKYTQADIDENPTLAEMTRAALLVLEQAIDGFWLMVEAGDIDWANHANNLDNSIGAVLSGEQAFNVILDWVDENDAWSHTAVIVTADHGHYLVIDDPQRIIDAGKDPKANH
jgi:alkaline phosphatase